MQRSLCRKALRATTLPVRLAAHFLFLICPHNRRRSRIAMGVGLILGGSYMACIHQAVVPHFMQDALAYLVHGVGTAPLVEELISFLEQEGG